MTARAALAQLAAWGAFAAFVGYFSSAPPYQALAADRALVKLSLSHAGERRHACRERTPEELARLAPNMRAQLDCPRERSDLRVELEMDGSTIASVHARAAGLRRDLPATVYRRIEVPAGSHTFRARLADDAGGEFRHRAEKQVTLAPGGLLVVDFAASRGGFVFLHREAPGIAAVERGAAR
jgi:hypothetical protein